MEPATTCPHCGYRWRRLTAGKHFFQLRQIIKQLNGKLLIKNTKQLIKNYESEIKIHKKKNYATFLTAGKYFPRLRQIIKLTQGMKSRIMLFQTIIANPLCPGENIHIKMSSSHIPQQETSQELQKLPFKSVLESHV